jgi:preprotein translocase subunit SecA
MEEGQAIESKMVSRRIAAAQKKVEERHFDSRKHLLEYDEVMDTQRKNIYGYRQRILENANCKILLLEMLQKQVTEAVDEYLNRDYGPGNFAKFAVNRVGVDFEAADFRGVDFDQAVRDVRERAVNNVAVMITDFIEENLGAEDAKEWNWQALANKINDQWDQKVTDRQLKQLGKDALPDFLHEKAVKAIEEIDLSEGKQYLDPLYGLKSVCDLALRKFLIKVKPEDLAGKAAAEIKKLLMDAVRMVYREKEIQFPVMAAMARYMTDRSPGMAAGGQRYNREGLYHWATTRFPAAAAKLNEEDFRTQSRAKLMELLLQLSREAYPPKDQQAIDEKLEESLHGTTHSEPEDAKELVEWAKAELGLDIPEAALTGVTHERARQVLWNAFDYRYRAEMRSLERSLLLYHIDSGWKNHLAAMDSLRSGIGLYGYAQEDPKIKYKQEGMKEFKAMWEGIEDRVTDTVFRMEETEAFQESVWAISATRHDAAPRSVAQDDKLLTNAGGEKKKAEPIRNRGEKVGRNDPCPCGSGKKYKNCHMRQTA